MTQQSLSGKQGDLSQRLIANTLFNIFGRICILALGLAVIPYVVRRLGAAIGCCGLLVHSFADFNLQITASAAWYVLCPA